MGVLTSKRWPVSRSKQKRASVYPRGLRVLTLQHVDVLQLEALQTVFDRVEDVLRRADQTRRKQRRLAIGRSPCGLARPG
jgi:hypothetical protein